MFNTLVLVRIIRRNRAALKEAAEQLDKVKRAQDPGRDIHERLAVSFESEMVNTGPRENVAARRAAGMTMAAGLIEAARRANLKIVPVDEEVPG